MLRPTPPPRDPSSIGTLVRSLLDLRTTSDEDGMRSSDSSPTRLHSSSSPPRLHSPTRLHSSSPTRIRTELRRSSSPPRLHSSPPTRLHSSSSPRLHSSSPTRLHSSSELRRSSYDNMPAPPRPPSVRRSTPSPSRLRGEDPPAPPLLGRRRPASACGARIRQAPQGCGQWGCGACGPQPCHRWCGGGGPPQTWGHYHHHQVDPSPHDCEEDLLQQQRIWQLEAEKEQLTLQVNVLSEQVDAQSEKMSELESALSRNQEQLVATEALLNKESGCRSSAESSRLELMSEIAELKTRLATTEGERRAAQERNRRLQSELLLTAACLAEKEADLAALRNGTISDNDNPELEKLKTALSSVMAANDEKERKIQDLNSSLQRYKKLHELVLSNYSMKNNEVISKISPYSEDNFLSALDNLASCADISDVVDNKPPSGRLLRLSPLPPPQQESRYSSSDHLLPPTPQKTPPSKRHYSTLPRPHQAEILKQFDAKSSPTSPIMTPTSGGSRSTSDLRRNEVVSRRSPTKVPPSGGSFGRGFFKLKGGKRSSSAPHLAPDQLEDPYVGRSTSPAPPPKEKAKGLRKIFGRVRRSGSESLNPSAAELKRGGIRATAGPRLGYTPEENRRTTDNIRLKDQPFCEWDCESVCEWLESIGLSEYSRECRRWGKGGRELLQATDFEKELCIRSPLHRKKLLLSLLGAKGASAADGGGLDHLWVVRWLDDIGLPQYKDAFLEGRVDGRMLHHLTLEDLSHLKVTNQLHHASIRAGIRVLRESNFDPFCMQRRSLTPNTTLEGEDVSRWSIHRVMEWLRSVDLSEYAPNLRGSGVHGGIMLYESRFDADLLATLLNIPPSKTLLRRHLSTQFKQLIGPEATRTKREAANHVPLSPSAKVKSLKRSPFSLVKRKNRVEGEGEEYVCPMQNRTEEEKFLMKEIVSKNEKILETMPASNV